jgi:hypothetical protein
MKGAVNGAETEAGYLPPKSPAGPAGGSGYVPLTYNGGPVLQSAELVALYWGNFTEQDVETMQTYLTEFCDYLSGVDVPGNEVPTIWQYEAGCATVGQHFVARSAPTKATDGDVKNKVVALQGAGSLPPFAANRLFLVFTKGVSFSGYGTVWCAYHSAWALNEWYAICPFPAAGGCGSGYGDWQSSTSHEVLEAMTDPGVGSGWTEGGGEGGDSCNWQEVAMGWGTVQRFADNDQSRCSIYTPFWDFSVKPFSPWAGYGIPNGLWMVGDFNGDSRADIVHAVQNTDYVNVWLSNGDGTFSVKPFSPWAGYSIPNGLWMVGDFNGDRRADIVHAVQNTDYVNVWLSNGDGTFSVKPFSAWAGYGIPNGLWMVGDFTGDGRADIVHAVQNTDYVNVWLSNGNGTFTVKGFRPWAGYSIPNGLWMVGDFNGDGRADILHAVQNTDYVNVWLSNGDGTFTVKSFSPWAGYAIPNGLWMVGDFNGDGRADIVHAVQGTDSVNVWLSNGDGTFAVTPFSPWAGYSIPNGLWLVGDYNGDRRADILHAVQGTDTANVWISNGDGSFTVTPFSPWPGYSIPNGLWLPGDHDADGRTDIVHAVNNTAGVNVWLARNVPNPCAP